MHLTQRGPHPKSLETVSITLHGKRDLANVIEELEMGGYPSGPNVTTRVLVRGRPEISVAGDDKNTRLDRQKEGAPTQRMQAAPISFSAGVFKAGTWKPSESTKPCNIRM